jgi:pyridoxamine 5'-phosphate oxidase
VTGDAATGPGARPVPGLRERLRATPSFAPSAPPFDPSAAPAAPGDLFREWIVEALDAGAPAPQAAVLSTSTPDGDVRARTLVVKDVVADSWLFATERTSPKARAIAANPVAALTFFWPTRARQVKVSGPVRDLGPEVAAADFLARSPQSRAASLVGHQSEPLGSLPELQAAYDEAFALASADPTLVDPAWALYAVDATVVEFWQTAPDRSATRWCYRRAGDGWSAGLLWP